MITFFTTAKPFEGHDGIIQRNALQSWTLLYADVEVILFGDDRGASEVCAELGLRHEPNLERHESGMKYLNYMFERAQQIARHDFLCYSNCDIVLMNDFREAFERALTWRKRFLMIAQRWDTDVKASIDFCREDWAKNLHQLAVSAGHLQVPDFIDFFVFPKGLYDTVPPLVVGRSYWDHWLVWKALSKHVSVLDASHVVVPVHQNHGYAYHPQGKQGTNEDALAKRNIELAANGSHLRSMLDSTHRITRAGQIRRTRFRRIFESAPALALRQMIAEKTFPLRSRLGLRRKTSEKVPSPPPNSCY